MLDQSTSDLRSRLLARIDTTPTEVWTPSDFANLGSRAAVDKTLQRLVCQSARKTDPRSASNFDPLVAHGGERPTGWSWSGLRSPVGRVG